MIISNITIKNKAKIINEEYVIKPKKQSLTNIFNYLKSRSFEYYPEIIKEENQDIYYEYIKEVDTPQEQKIIDLVLITSLLHNKTTIYKEVDLDYYKYIYESISTNIEDTYNYYNNLILNIEKEIYMSPSNYLIARNISMIYNNLIVAKKNINNWYKLVKDKNQVRLSVIHNNLSIDHYLKSNKPYLISWDKTNIDMPIYDMVNIYKHHALDFNFKDIFKIYIEKYPYTDEEMALFLTIIAIPDKIENKINEYQNVTSIRKHLDYIYKTSNFLKEYRIKKQENKSQEFQKQN